MARESEQATQSQLQTAISVGATLFGALLGRKAVTTSTLGRATTAARGAGRVLKERQDVGRAQENLEALRQQLADLEAQFERDAETEASATDPLESHRHQADQAEHRGAPGDPRLGPRLAGRARRPHPGLAVAHSPRPASGLMTSGDIFDRT